MAGVKIDEVNPSNGGPGICKRPTEGIRIMLEVSELQPEKTENGVVGIVRIRGNVGLDYSR